MWDSGVHVNCFYEWWLTKEYNISFVSEELKAEFLHDIDTKKGWIWDRLLWLRDEKNLTAEQMYWYWNKYEKYLDKDFVNAFLREREKNIGPNRYKIKIVPDPTPADEEVIGEVVLMRKNKVIEKATLITRTNIPDAEKLIYWKF
jgi:hypothetical protein